MIYTVTLNPAIDVSLFVKDGLAAGRINKSYGMNAEAGGKGINVSKYLKALGVESVVCAGFCGTDGERLQDMLKDEFEVLSVTYPSGNTRTNIKITDGNGITTDINGDGPVYDKASVELLKTSVSGRLTSGDTVVISGRPPHGSPSDIYADLIRSLSTVEGVKMILDCSGEFLSEGLKAKPYAVKPTCEELGFADDVETALREAARIVSEGVTHCIISMGKNGSVFAGVDSVPVYSKALDVDVHCTTGCGDAMTAGLAYAFETKMPSSDIFAMCVAMASAEAETEGTKAPSKERIMELVDAVRFCGQ